MSSRIGDSKTRARSETPPREEEFTSRRRQGIDLSEEEAEEVRAALMEEVYGDSEFRNG